MGSVSYCALVALLFMLASGYSVVHKEPGKRLKLTLTAGVCIYTVVQMICGVAKTLVSSLYSESNDPMPSHLKVNFTGLLLGSMNYFK